MRAHTWSRCDDDWVKYRFYGCFWRYWSDFREFLMMKNSEKYLFYFSSKEKKNQKIRKKINKIDGAKFIMVRQIVFGIMERNTLTLRLWGDLTTKRVRSDQKTMGSIWKLVENFHEELFSELFHEYWRRQWFCTLRGGVHFCRLGDCRNLEGGGAKLFDIQILTMSNIQRNNVRLNKLAIYYEVLSNDYDLHI